jgi:hypothetical protein
MSDGECHLDSALIEVERARKFVAKVKARQIRNVEQRDFLKATALSWFRTHRAFVAPLLDPEALSSIDTPYRTVLDATERDSGKGTYVAALRKAKDALVRARSDTLLAHPTVRTEDAAPDFRLLASSGEMQAILARRWDECTRCLQANAPLAAAVMMGGLLEALFVSRANQLVDKSSLFRAKAAPIDAKTRKALDLRQWTLAPYIDVGHELKWISHSAKDVGAILRDYRNYVHPEKERAHGIVLTLDDARMLWEVTKSLSRELLGMKGAGH